MVFLGVVGGQVLLVGGDGERQHFAAPSLAELDVSVEQVVEGGEGGGAHTVHVTHQQSVQLIGRL